MQKTLSTPRVNVHFHTWGWDYWLPAHAGFSWDVEGADSISIVPAMSNQCDSLPLSGTIAGQVFYSTWFTLTVRKGVQVKTAKVWVEVRFPVGSNWPGPRGDMMNPGRSLYPGPETSWLKWRYDLGVRSIYSSHNGNGPIINHDGSVIVGDTHLTVINPDGTLTGIRKYWTIVYCGLSVFRRRTKLWSCFICLYKYR